MPLVDGVNGREPGSAASLGVRRMVKEGAVGSYGILLDERSWSEPKGFRSSDLRLTRLGLVRADCKSLLKQKILVSAWRSIRCRGNVL